jgi:hypothetical protein
MAFKEYDLIGAGSSFFGGRSQAATDRRFCSQLVTEAYARAGLVLIPGRHPEQVTPNMLVHSSELAVAPLPLMDARAFGSS